MMRKFVINVNGNQYEVEVEEVGGNSTTVQTAPAAAPVAAPEKGAPTPAPSKPAAAPAAGAAAPAGALKITAPMPGTILELKVKAGDAIKKGDVVAILDAMKMENEIVAPQDGSIASVHVAKGASVNSGDLLISIS